MRNPMKTSKIVAFALLGCVVLAGCSTSPKSEAELKSQIPEGYTDGGKGVAWKIGETYFSYHNQKYSPTCGNEEIGRICLDVSFYTYKKCNRLHAVGTENDPFTDAILNRSLPGETKMIDSGVSGTYQITQTHSPGSLTNDGYWVVTGLTCN